MIINYLRNRGKLIGGIVGVGLLAFLIGPQSIQFFKDAYRGASGELAPNEVGKVGDEVIMYDVFSKKLEQNTNNFKQQMGGSINPQMSSYIMDNTWNQSVSEILMRKEVERLGLSVSKAEINDMLMGKNPDPQVVQNFGDPKTGQVNRAQIAQFLSNVETQPASSPIREQWGNFLVGLKQNRLTQKYSNLVKNCVYITALEAREDYNNRNKLANFTYVSLDYASIPDNQVKPSDSDFKDYYDENINRFKNREETRSFDYVVFDATPSKADSAAIKSNVYKLAEAFKTATNDSLFVNVNSDNKAPIAYVHKGQLDPALDSLVFKAGNGSIIGPVFSNGVYKIAKVLDTRMSPDSVKASHILLNPATEGGLDKATAKADSLVKLIQSGTSFAELAKKFGTDASKDKGGELGTFGRGAMIPAFEEAVFNGKAGDLKVIKTQYGVHIIHIDSQKGSSKVAKVAIVDKALESSEATQQTAYRNASAFLGSVSDGKDFDAKAQKANLKKQTAENIAGSQSAIPGLDNSRKVIQWAFKSDEGTVSDEVFELENKYVIAKVTDIHEKGTLPLEKVKKQIEPAVINRVKGKMLSEKLQNAANGATTISQIAQKVGKQAVPVQNIVFANPIIPGQAQENKVVGTIFGMQPGKISKPILGEHGVYIVTLNGLSKPAPLTNAFKQKEQMMQAVSQRLQGEAFSVLKDKANVKDNRVKFF